MNRTSLFDEVSSCDALFDAWELFRRGKRNRDDVQKFWRRLEGNIFALRRELVAETYQHGSYESFYISDPKRRHIRKARVSDRLVHQVVHTVLARIWEPCLIHHLYSARQGKGTHAGVDTLAKMTLQVSRNYIRPCWALKCDIRKFYDSVDHSILMALIEKRVADKKFLRIVFEIVNSFHTQEHEGKGLPIGNLTSQVFTNIYLNELDQFIKHELRVKQYARFSDDFVLLSEQRSDLLCWLPRIEEFLQQKLKLSLHPSKVDIRPLHQGVDFLGYVVLPHHRALRSASKRRMLKRLSHRHSEAVEDQDSTCIFKQSLSSYLGMLSHADTFELACMIRNKFSIA